MNVDNFKIWSKSVDLSWIDEKVRRLFWQKSDLSPNFIMWQNYTYGDMELKARLYNVMKL